MSVADADTYLDTQLGGSEWIAADTDSKERALRSATRLLDTLEWRGAVTDPLQPLAWPRRAVRDPRSNGLLDPEAIPVRVAWATAELAAALLGRGGIRTTAVVTRKKVGDLELEYAPTVCDELPGQVRKLLAPFLRDESAHSVRLVA